MLKSQVSMVVNTYKGTIMPKQDHRARLQPKNLQVMSDIFGPNDPSNILAPLYSTNGVMFPYTPIVTGGNTATYDSTDFIHSNYGYNAYVRSFTKPINITADFTAQTTSEAYYMLAVIHFFRYATKSYFGINPYNLAGTPPPVLLFNYLGQHQYSNVPVVIKDFGYTYDNTVDYVGIDTSKIGTSPGVKTSDTSTTYLPVKLQITIELDNQYTPIDLRNNFNLEEFRTGKLFAKGYI